MTLPTVQVERIGQFVATLMFLKILEEEKLIHRVYSKDYNCLTFPKGFNTNNLENDSYGDPKELHKDYDIVEFLKYNDYFILDPELIDYIKNDCRTEKKRQYDEQLGLTRESLDKAGKSNLIAGIALIVSVFGVGVSAYWNYKAASASTKIDTLQFQQICHSMESPKLVKVENDTFVVNAKGDTISFKHVAKPVTQLPQSADSTKSENVKNGTFGCRCKCRGCKRQANDKANDKPVTKKKKTNK